jgi:hypothetical protein
VEVDNGVTLTVIVGAVPLKAVPLDKVPVIVPVPVAVIVKLVLPPLQIVVEPLRVPVGLALTVTVALPVLSAAIDAHVPFVKVAIVYIVVEEGLTPTVIKGATPLKTVPSDKVPVIVPLPVAVIVKLVLPPLQIVVEPPSVPVGLALTVTVALPVLSAASDVHVPFVNVAIV